MLSKTFTSAVVGLDGQIVEVEVDIAQGMPTFTIVGLPDTAVQESRERVRSAIRNSRTKFPLGRVTVSLAPSDLRKSGPAYDLPIAIGILAGSGQLPIRNFERSLLLGEIGLDGSVRHTQGILPMVAVGKRLGFERAFVPDSDVAEAALVHGIKIHGVKNLMQIVDHIRGHSQIHPFISNEKFVLENMDVPFADFRDVRGQEQAKRSMEIAAAGSHNLLMSGPPGSGKTLLARCMPGIIPRMTRDEALEVTTIYSVAGLLAQGSSIINKRPFRSPHYTISSAGLVGGGVNPRPGEITLSHRGILFLDELPEFGHASLDVLRQPLEDKTVTISRARGTVTFPANFMLVGAMNPCPCGYRNDSSRACVCPSSAITRYERRISGPLIDRIDLFVTVPRVNYDKLTAPPDSASSRSVRNRIEQARQIQSSRFQGSSLISNSDMGPKEVWKYCRTAKDGEETLKKALDVFGLSARGFHRILKVARTIADLAGEQEISNNSIGEAIQFRQQTK